MSRLTFLVMTTRDAQVRHVGGIVCEKWSTNRALIQLDDGRRLALPIPPAILEDVDAGTAVELEIADGGRVEAWDISRSPSRGRVPDTPAGRDSQRSAAGTAPTVGAEDKSPAGWLFGDSLPSPD